jgi:CHAT domain-containing protein
LRLLRDPSSAYSWLQQHDEGNPEQSEALLENAIRAWIPPAQNSLQVSALVLRKLAHLVLKNHSDSWLHDFLAAPSSVQAVTYLRSAISLNAAGNAPKAGEAGLQAANLFAKVGNQPGEIRSLFEFVYALDRQAKIPLCLHEGNRLRKAVAGRDYRWLQIQLSLEAANCMAKGLQFAGSWDFINRSVSNAEHFHYPVLYLRSLGTRAAFNDGEGRFGVAASEDLEGLELFWQGSYPGVRAQQFYSDLGFIARAAGRWHLDQALQQESLAILGEGEHQDLKAYAHFYAGSAAVMMGQNQAAQQELALARGLFHQLGNSIYEANAEVSLADVEVRQGRLQAAFQLLQDNASRLAEVDNVAVQLPLQMAQARIQQQEHHANQEKAFLERAVEIGNKGFKQISSERERWNWREKLKEPYLRLIALEIQGPHDSEQALADWEAFQVIASPAPIEGPAVFNVKAKDELQQRIRRMHDSTLVAFVGIPQAGLRIWVADDRGTHEIFVKLDADALEEEISKFRRLCSTPHSHVEDVQEVARDLYRQLLAPVENMLDKNRVVIIESDDLLNGLPWSALATMDHKYAGEVYAFEISPGILLERAEPFLQGRGRSLRPVIVVPGAVRFRDQQLPLLPQAESEAASVFQLLSPAIYLEGKAADRRNTLKYLSQASIIHFAGHALDARDHGAELLLSGRSPSNVLSASDLERIHLRHCKLVVLAACSTGTADGDITRNPQGLVKAFLNSGAEKVLASHWEVDSYATAVLMKRFYRNLLSRAGVAESLREAKRFLISQPATSLPYYWAGFDTFSGASVEGDNR